VLRSVAEIAVGAIYATGALFSTVYTLRHGDEFYGSFAEGAWLGPARWSPLAVMILIRGDLVREALIAGAIFSEFSALVSSPGGTVGTLALAAIQAALAVSR
jgi:hypothetical protein